MHIELQYERHSLCRVWSSMTFSDLQLQHTPYTWVQSSELFIDLFPDLNILCSTLLPIALLSHPVNEISVNGSVILRVLDALCEFRIILITHLQPETLNRNSLNKRFTCEIALTEKNIQPNNPRCPSINTANTVDRVYSNLSEELLSLCQLCLENRPLRCFKKSALIFGSGGVGKTSFLLELEKHLTIANSNTAFIRFSGIDSKASNDFSCNPQLFESERASLHDIVISIASILGEKGVISMVKNWIGQTDSAAPPLCILIDDIDAFFFRKRENSDFDDSNDTDRFPSSYEDSSVGQLLFRLLELVGKPTFQERVFVMATGGSERFRNLSFVAGCAEDGVTRCPIFDHYADIPKLTYRNRYDILQSLFRGLCFDEMSAENALLQSRLTVFEYYCQKVAELTEGFSPGDLVSMTNHVKRAKEVELPHSGGVDLPFLFESVVATRADIRRRAMAPLDLALQDGGDLDLHSSSQLSFAHFAGYEEVKMKIRRLLKTLRTDRTDNGNESNRLPVAPARGLVLHGPAGCGKTFLAKVLAAESRMNFLSVGSTQLLSKYFGDTERKLRALFSAARAQSPCILFFDDFDVLASRRGGQADSAPSRPPPPPPSPPPGRSKYDPEEVDTNEEDEDEGAGQRDEDEDGHADVQGRVLSTFLNELDGIQSHRSSQSAALSSLVLVVVACRRIGRLDEALLRPGRLQLHIGLDRPDPTSVREILRTSLPQSQRDCTEDSDLLDAVAAKAVRFRPNSAQVRAIGKEAVMAVVKESIQRREALEPLDGPDADEVRLSERHFDAAFQKIGFVFRGR